MRSKFEQARDFSKTYLQTENCPFTSSTLLFLVPNHISVPINVKLTQISILPAVGYAIQIVRALVCFFPAC